MKLAIIAIWVFAAQMFNITVASATSVHLIGGVFAAVLAGPFAGFLVISSVLIVQSAFFADGGFLALGANIFNMAFIGSFLSYYVYKAALGRHQSRYYFAVAAACFFSVLTAALFCLLELGLSGAVSFAQAFKDMMSLHFLFAVVETLITLILLKLFKLLEI
jgi:cobalt/nickel transport system permease protein